MQVGILNLRSNHEFTEFGEMYKAKVIKIQFSKVCQKIVYSNDDL